MLASPRRPLQPLNGQSPAAPSGAHNTTASPIPQNQTRDTRDIDLLCYETMPTPSELDRLAELARATAAGLQHREGPCFCLDACDTGRPCKAQRYPTRKRNRSPSPRPYTVPHKAWTQTIRLFHPTDFACTFLEIDSTVPFRAAFQKLCRDLQVDIKNVSFVWQRKRSRGGIEQVTLSEDFAPWHVGMRDGVLETIECDFI